jgi:hypothetical protein
VQERIIAMRYTSLVTCLAAGVMTLAAASTAAAGPLTVVNVHSPAYGFVFSPTGSIVVHDTSDTFAVSGAAGLARLQSRTALGLPGAPAAGLYRYSYRLDLTNVYGILNIPCIRSLTIRFGGVVSSLDYNGDGIIGDQVFVVTSGALGSVGVSSATKTGNNITFQFAGSGVCAGGSPGTGDSSFFFGLVSVRAPQFVTATVVDDSSMTYSPQARAPSLFFITALDVWLGYLQSTPQGGGMSGLALVISDVKGRRFEGSLSIGGQSDRNPAVIPVEGTFSEDGHLVISSHGRGVSFDAEATLDEGGPLLSGRYQVRSTDGSVDRGSFYLALDARLLPAVQFER